MAARKLVPKLTRPVIVPGVLSCDEGRAGDGQLQEIAGDAEIERRRPRTVDSVGDEVVTLAGVVTGQPVRDRGTVQLLRDPSAPASSEPVVAAQ